MAETMADGEVTTGKEQGMTREPDPLQGGDEDQSITGGPDDTFVAHADDDENDDEEIPPPPPAYTPPR